MKTLERLTVPSAAAWARWLLDNAASSQGVSLTLAKKGTKEPTSLSQNEAVEEALCHGWINGQGHSIDDATYMQRFTPRTSKSIWSKRNIGLVERLETEGRMQDAGRASVEAAKGDGRWQRAYSGAANLDEMRDLIDVLQKDPAALTRWDESSKGDKSQIYFRLSALKTQAGREKCIREYVEKLAQGNGTSATSPPPSGHSVNVRKRAAASGRGEQDDHDVDVRVAKIRKTRSGRVVRLPNP